MKNGIIDIGSNSVRLLFGGKKYMNNTQLAENLIHTGTLCKQATERTAAAIKEFYEFCMDNGAEKVYAFATEAVRAAKNGRDFVREVERIGVSVEVLSSEIEAKCGFCGAYSGKGIEGILDIGGASSELAVGDAKGLLYAHSLPLGSVRLKDYAPDASVQAEYAAIRVKEYGLVPKFDKLVAIGGTLSQIVAVMKELEPYDSERVHGTVLTREDVKKTTEMILSVPTEERINIKGLHPKKLLVAPAGGVLALAIMDYLGAETLTVSEKDNLEGYAKIKGIEI